MPLREIQQLFGTSHFRVLIGRRELGFAEVSRLSSETDPTLPRAERSHRFETVVLRRALTRSTELYDWRRKIVAGKDDRRLVTIHQLDSAGGAIVNSWRLEGAWPCRWPGRRSTPPAATSRSRSSSSPTTISSGCRRRAPRPIPSRSRTTTEGA